MYTCPSAFLSSLSSLGFLPPHPFSQSPLYKRPCEGYFVLSAAFGSFSSTARALFLASALFSPQALGSFCTSSAWVCSFRCCGLPATAQDFLFSLQFLLAGQGGTLPPARIFLHIPRAFPPSSLRLAVFPCPARAHAALSPSGLFFPSPWLSFLALYHCSSV